MHVQIKTYWSRVSYISLMMVSQYLMGALPMLTVEGERVEWVLVSVVGGLIMTVLVINAFSWWTTHHPVIPVDHTPTDHTPILPIDVKTYSMFRNPSILKPPPARSKPLHRMDPIDEGMHHASERRIKIPI